MKFTVHLLLLFLCILNSNTNSIAQSIDLELQFETNNALFQNFTSGDFILTITNDGTDDATGVIVDFPVLEQGATRVAGTTEAVSNGTYNIFSGIWEVGTISAGGSARIEIQLFALAEDINLFAQVIEARQEDTDSTPNNGVCCDAEEDDEAAFSNGDALHKFVYCPSDIVVTVPRGAAGTNVYYPDPIFESDCPSPFEVEQIRPVGKPSGSFFNVGFTGALYEASGELCGERLCAFNIIVQERDKVVDLELRAATDTPVLRRYESAQYTLTLTNNSNEDATDVKVQLDIPETIKQVGRFRPIASTGRYIPFYRLWEVGDLAAGESETLVVALFALEDNQQALAQVIAAGQADEDSFPSSASCCVAVEDDEVVLNALIPTPGLIGTTTPQINTDYSVFPNPAQHLLHLAFHTTQEVVHWGMYDMQGKQLQQARWNTTNGYNERTLDVQHLTSGVYYISVQSEEGVQTLRFVKS